MNKTNSAQTYDYDDPSNGHKETSSMRLLAGDPQTAIRKLAFPMMLGMLVQTLYNLVDTFWVSGLGADALAAVGFVFPFFLL